MMERSKEVTKRVGAAIGHKQRRAKAGSPTPLRYRFSYLPEVFWAFASEFAGFMATT